MINALSYQRRLERNEIQQSHLLEKGELGLKR